MHAFEFDLHADGCLNVSLLLLSYECLLGHFDLCKLLSKFRCVHLSILRRNHCRAASAH
ncbi:hypothetical protein H4V98_000968 [Polaromonas sp. CG_23.6]|nr:hypothetical protein [Polaromonas sp. CG_23.6]